MADSSVVEATKKICDLITLGGKLTDNDLFVFDKKGDSGNTFSTYSVSSSKIKDYVLTNNSTRDVTFGNITATKLTASIDASGSGKSVLVPTITDKTSNSNYAASTKWVNTYFKENLLSSSQTVTGGWSFSKSITATNGICSNGNIIANSALAVQGGTIYGKDTSSAFVITPRGASGTTDIAKSGGCITLYGKDHSSYGGDVYIKAYKNGTTDANCPYLQLQSSNTTYNSTAYPVINTNSAMVLTRTNDVSSGSWNSPALTVGGVPNGIHMEIDSNEIMAKKNATTGNSLYINDINNGHVHIAGSDNGNIGNVFLSDNGGVVYFHKNKNNYIQVVRSDSTNASKIERNACSKNWYNGREGALIATVQTAALTDQYCPIMSCKSTHGSWDFATYTTTSTEYMNNNLTIAYITDDRYNNSTNDNDGLYIFHPGGPSTDAATYTTREEIPTTKWMDSLNYLRNRFYLNGENHIAGDNYVKDSTYPTEITLGAGNGWGNNGASIALRSGDYSADTTSNDNGAFILVASKGTVDQKYFIGYPNGQLTWCGSNIVRSVKVDSSNTYLADTSGIVDLSAKFNNYLPRSGGTMTGDIIFNNGTRTIRNKNNNACLNLCGGAGEDYGASLILHGKDRNPSAGKGFFTLNAYGSSKITLKGDADGKLIWNGSNIVRKVKINNSEKTVSDAGLVDLGTYTTESDLTSYAKTTALASYLPLAGGTMTGGITLNPSTTDCTIFASGSSKRLVFYGASQWNNGSTLTLNGKDYNDTTGKNGNFSLRAGNASNVKCALEGHATGNNTGNLTWGGFMVPTVSANSSTNIPSPLDVLQLKFYNNGTEQKTINVIGWVP